MELYIEGRSIGINHPCFIIAEAGVNHKLEQEDMEKIGSSSSLDVAFKMIDAAKEAGADAIKFQSFSAEMLQYKGAGMPRYQLQNLGGDEDVDYYNLIKKLETSRDEQTKIAEYCKKKRILFLSTPYDPESADFLDKEIQVPLFKLASIELNNHLFVKYVALKGKPIILSTGLGTIEDVRSIMNIASREGFVERLVLLQCTSDYPTSPDDVNLNVLNTYKKEYPDLLFGFSDHCITNTASIGAVALGAKVLEKHFTLGRNFKGPDHMASLDAAGLKGWVRQIKEMETLLGSYKKEISKSEKKNASMRKYLVIAPQKAGSVIKEESLRTMRTGNGILPIEKNIVKIVGKKIKYDVYEVKPLSWEMLE